MSSERHPTDRASLERDCEVEAIRGGGPGGQHANKNETGVRLTHRPTGLVITATERRSRKRNMDSAFDRMACKLDQLQRPRKPRHETRPSKGVERRREDARRRHARKKAERRWKPE
ncbi:MAG: peptide chain release factor-like protein [Alphaproteobacteria bacterium]|nr:peptide chain release factor-like protein [Alphaproteobacteria bacterium]